MSSFAIRTDLNTALDYEDLKECNRQDLLRIIKNSNEFLAEYSNFSVRKYHSSILSLINTFKERLKNEVPEYLV
jgi:hypothetical protein